MFHFYVYKYVLSDWDYETLEHFRIIDKQLQLLMRATFKNSNILQCCQRKSVQLYSYMCWLLYNYNGPCPMVTFVHCTMHVTRILYIMLCTPFHKTYNC